MVRKLSRFGRAAALGAVLSLALTGFGESAQAWPGLSPLPPFFYPSPSPYRYYAPHREPQSPQSQAPRCDGSEPLAGGIFGAALGGILGSLLSERHGKSDPGATIFGMIAGAMLGASLAANHCDP